MKWILYTITCGWFKLHQNIDLTPSFILIVPKPELSASINESINATYYVYYTSDILNRACYYYAFHKVNSSTNLICSSEATNLSMIWTSEGGIV